MHNLAEELHQTAIKAKRDNIDLEWSTVLSLLREAAEEGKFQVSVQPLHTENIASLKTQGFKYIHYCSEDTVKIMF